jgi:toluene monooxygenase system protein A
MPLLKTEEWYDIARDTNWTPRYVTEQQLFPPELTDRFGVPLAAMEGFDEPYKVTYREYVRTQREKDMGAYSVKAALARSKLYENADPGWRALLQLHFGAASFLEYNSISAFARMTRFSRAPGMRNMATFGSLDETRHSQIHLYFAYEHLIRSRSFDWAHKAPRSNNWVIISERHTFDDIEHTRDAVSAAIMTNFAFETAFTNLQFVALSADAANYGDFSFSTMLQTIQSDEARHAQIGEPLLRILIDSGFKAEAQKLVDISFWRCWKQFSALSGICMDYYTPLENREYSFKEFMHEWVIDQFMTKIFDIGLEKPWYWDLFLEDIDVFHHAQHIGVYLYRATEWWHPVAATGPAEREWLETKYPGWGVTFGKVWDVIAQNVASGRHERTQPSCLPMLCNMHGFELTGVPGAKWNVKDYTLDRAGRRYHFQSPVDKWIFEQEPERYAGHLSLIDRVVQGVVSLDKVFDYMHMAPEERGTDGQQYRWTQEPRGGSAGDPLGRRRSAG